MDLMAIEPESHKSAHFTCVSQNVHKCFCLIDSFGAQKQAEAHRVDMFESQSEAGDDTIPIHFDGDEPSEDGSSGSSGDDSFGDDYDAMESGFDSFISNRRDTAYKVLTAFEDEEEEQRQLLEQHRLSDLPSPTHSNGSTPGEFN